MAQTLANDPTQDAIKKALQSGQLDQAQKLVMQARETAPKNVQWQFMEGVIQAQQGQTDKAIDTFKKITEAHPDLSEAFNNLGVLYAAKGRLEESRTYLEKALQTHPSYAAAHRNLSDVMSQLAKDSYGKALQVDPKVRNSTPQLTLLGSITPEKRMVVSTAKASAPTNTPTSLVASAPVSPATPGPALAASNAQVVPSAAKPASSPAIASVLAPKPAAQASAPLPTAAAKSNAPAAPAAATTASVLMPNMQAKPATAGTTTALPQAASQTASKAAAADTTKAAATPATANRPADQDAVKSAVLDWARAWSQKDMKRYLAAYASHFNTGNMTRANWEADRQLKILSKKTISVNINKLQIDVKGDAATARFQQIYTSDYFQGNSRKTLELRKQGERWLIIRESVN